MNDVMKSEAITFWSDAAKSADIKITLEQWPCTIAVLGVCATYAFVSWINKSAHEVGDKAA